MSTHRHINKICALAVVLALLLCIVFMNAESLGISDANRVMGYEKLLFDTEKVHSIDIIMEDWDSFIASAQSEEYSPCTVIIDGESFTNVGLRGKGNTSLSSVSGMGSQRYSFKLEFDQYDPNISYHGLDKLSLNNLIQDASFMKDYLTYRLMAEGGAAAPLCSFAYITVNGEDWGLYLAVEAVEDSFLQRNYGSAHGELYKPDSMDMGGGRGAGRDFSPSEFFSETQAPNIPAAPDSSFTGPQRPNMGNMPDTGGGRGDMGSSDVLLQYTDDDAASYSNIFNNAKTDITEADEKRLIASLKALSEGEDIASVVDIEAALRYFVVHNFVVNGDSYTGGMVHNYYLYEENGLMSMLPWDYNLAFGSFQGSSASETVNDPIDTPLSVSGSGRPMIDWIFASGEYTELYHQYFAEFLESTDILGIIDSTRELIAPYVEKDPTAFYSYEEFTAGAEALRTFCALRIESVRGQLGGSIPSTDAGQAAEPSALVDASALSLSDMGGMDMGGSAPGGMGGMESPGSFGGEISRRPEMGEMPQRPNAASAPHIPSDFTPQSTVDSALAILAAAALLLALGLIAAWKYRR